MKIKINLIVFLMLFGMSTFLNSSNTINIQLRFYQGFNEKQNITDSDRSFSLTENNQQVLSFQEIDKEMGKIKSIYNLKKIKNITNLSFEFLDNEKKQIKDLYFTKKDIKISLTRHVNKNNKFELKIYKGMNNKTILLNTMLILPAKKATVIGFRDKNKNIYFFSLYRKDETQAKKQSKNLLPEILNENVPEYPKEALNAGKQGYVILEGEINENGKIQKIKIWQGDPLLNGAALKAFNDWKFTAYKVSSPDKLMKVVLILVFEINMENKNLKNKLRKIKNTDIWKQIMDAKKKEGKAKPWLLKMWIVQGEK